MGSIFIRNYYAVFDVENKRVGLALAQRPLIEENWVMKSIVISGVVLMIFVIVAVIYILKFKVKEVDDDYRLPPRAEI